MAKKNHTPTIADVARQAGISIATVSRVLNGIGSVSERTDRRVRAAIDDLNYVPRSAARVLASRKTDTLGLLLPEIGGTFFQPLLRGIEAGASEAGYDLLINTTNIPRPRHLLWRPLGEHNTDGLLVFTDSVDLQELTRLSNNGFPIILLHQTPPRELDIPVTTIENQSGARNIVDHLIEVHGCRRIAFLRGPHDHEDSALREQGYRQALQAHGISFDPALVARGNFNHEVAHRAVRGLLEQGVRFDGVFSGDDDSAIGVLLALREAGCKVPEEVAVVGFDDQVFAASLIPPLTTVRAPTEQVGREAVRQLVRIIHGESVEPRLVLPTELVIRQSCGCRR
jgi:LacI family transcriptional regulator